MFCVYSIYRIGQCIGIYLETLNGYDLTIIDGRGFHVRLLCLERVYYSVCHSKFVYCKIQTCIGYNFVSMYGRPYFFLFVSHVTLNISVLAMKKKGEKLNHILDCQKRHKSSMTLCLQLVWIEILYTLISLDVSLVDNLDYDVVSLDQAGKLLNDYLSNVMKELIWNNK